ncbi:MAG: hypothetical protein WD359_06850 [Dehalococcoidia bacterium]
MPPIDWLKLVLFPTDGEPTALDPIRIQKALFYISRSDQIPSTEKYTFVPYNYGPYSKAIYDDLDELVANQLAVPVQNTSRRWSQYQLTPAGTEHVRQLMPEIPGEWVVLAAETRHLVTSLTFKALLRRVYAEYPDFAENSIANI